MKTIHDKHKGYAIQFDDAYLVQGARTPFGKLCGSLSTISPTDLGIIAAKGALNKSGIDPGDIDQVIFSNIGQCSADAYFLPRHIGLYAGIPISVPALMVQRICGSGFETIAQAAEQIALGKAQVILCGGTESMSLSPTAAFGNRMGYALGRPGFVDMLWEALNDTAAVPMGNTAENVAKQLSISKEEANIFAKRSVDAAIAARENGYFTDEIISVTNTELQCGDLKPRKVKLPKGIKVAETDEHIRPTQLEDMAHLPSAFMKDGVQTAANSSGMVDGAAAVIIASENYITQNKLKPLSKIKAVATTGLHPSVMGLGPVSAIEMVLAVSGLSLSEVDYFEINEAFAAQYLGCEKQLGLDRNKTNIHGGAIALGHPLAATGTRLSLTLSRTLMLQKGKYGIASACIGGGQGIAILFESCTK